MLENELENSLKCSVEDAWCGFCNKMLRFRQMNDLVRDKFTDEKGNIPLFAEILAGGTVRNKEMFCAS